ncbi:MULTISPECIES: hypothetical protein [unclassified Brevundimonas]|jgi:hypothetical protein|uniref:hypothetical protein n=1 Tax=unclassified Brevundimonas TaxID=2622653 RepID=UPI000C36BC78|nr:MULTISPECIES: hypothetical protein [unclassified Brevundimonas]MAL89594.1 hypothetical protein [Brevundimonas sp.]HAJ02627.1 hypothetical protein [Brevundimonas sp.]HAV50333.1 hypothetical protein [Brevundimonas sp.]|tara:strand:+ start:23083 stop:23598 length:516 start_codon:yes stop_codon:yes gene_type:complete
MRVPFLTAFGILGAALLAAGTAAPPRLPMAIEVLALDSATYEQGRYVERLVERAGEPSAWFEYQPSQFEPESLERCMDSSISGAEVCVRYQIAEQDLKQVRPVHVVVLVGPGEGGTAQARCIGIGGQPHSDERQTAALNPASVLYAGTAQFDEDLNALAGCITAAGAESGW